VRFLFTFAGGRGHLDPLLPVARAARAAGHAVAFTGTPRVVEVAAADGFPAFPTYAAAPEDRPRRVPLRPVDRAREDEVLCDVFAGRLARRRATGVLARCAEWDPDLLVCDEVDFGAMVAAERLGLPHATVLVIASAEFVRAEVVAPPLDALRAEHGLAADPELAMLRRDLVLSPFPSSLRPPPPGALAFRPAAFESAPGAEPLVYFTLGTVFNLEAGDLYTRVLAGIATLPVEVVVSVGAGIDPAELGPQPGHVRVEQHVDHAALLPRCSAVVSHGGSGTLVGALAHGLPSVLLPLGADQPLNADRAAQLGVARVLDAIEATPADVCAATAAILDERAYRDAARRIAEEIAALPGPESAVELLERLRE
jgi:UDP:flavonoid glycosyltransferase YjiC (YdhE family)